MTHGRRLARPTAPAEPRTPTRRRVMGKLLKWFLNWKAMKKAYDKGRSDERKRRRR
jgi:hypothetical protein